MNGDEAIKKSPSHAAVRINHLGQRVLALANGRIFVTKNGLCRAICTNGKPMPYNVDEEKLDNEDWEPVK